MADIDISVAANTRSAESGLERVRSKVAGLSRGAGSTFKGVLGAQAVAAAASSIVGSVRQMAGEVIDAGSALQQSSGGVAAVFGRDTKKISSAAKSAAQNVGLSRNAYQELATVLGAGLKNQGIKDFAGETQKVIGLGGDLAAQYGGSTKDAVEAVTSLMRGETDPIEKYGVSINETAVSAELAARGQSKLTGAALTQAKAQARLGLLFKQTKDAQGAFAREADTYAGKQQRNAAKIEDLKAKLGTALLPVATMLQTVFANQVLPVLLLVVNAFSRNLPAGIAAGKAALATVAQFIAPAVAAIQRLFNAFQSGEGGSGLSALTAVFNGVKAVLSTVAPIVLQVVTTIYNALATNMPVIKSILTELGAAFAAVASIIASVWAKIGPVILPVLTTVINTVISIVRNAVRVISGVVKLIAAILKGDWAGAWNAAKQIVMGVVGIVVSLVKGLFKINDTIFRAIAKAIVSAWIKVYAATSAQWAKIKTYIFTKLLQLDSKLRALPAKAKAALSNAGTVLLSAGRQLVAGFLAGINERLGDVATKAREIATRAINAAKSALGINSPSRVFAALAEFTVTGFTGRLSKLASDVAQEGRNIAGALVAGYGRPELAADLSTAGQFAGRAVAGGSAGRIVIESLTIEVARGVSGAEIGRELLGYIREYERAGGK